MPRAIASDGPAMWTGFAVEQDLALVGRGQPVEDVHERGLAGAVLAEQGVDLARADVEVDVVVGDHARVALGDAAHLERRRGDLLAGLLGIGWRRSCARAPPEHSERADPRVGPLGMATIELRAADGSGRAGRRRSP